mgnify:CR=1 FL=1
MVKINFHGELKKEFEDSYDLEVDSVSEAIHAIDMMTNGSIRRYFINPKNKFKSYHLVVNGKKTFFPGFKNLHTSEVTINRKDLKTIDIVPLLEGGSGWDWVGTTVGVIGMFRANDSYSFMAAATLAYQGISNLLSKPPEPPEHQKITNPSSDPTELAKSYLFSGPSNVLNEGGPVPVGYGRLMVGSQVIMASYEVERLLTKDAGGVI